MSAIKETVLTTRTTENEDISRDDSRSPSVYSDHFLDDMTNTDEKGVVDDAQALITKDMRMEPPALPARNSLRTSRLLDSLRLNSIKSATESISTPHDTYLSSEEDASSSADDFSGEDFDVDDDEDRLVETPGSGTSSVAVSDKPSRRKSHEDTARVVSVVFVGRPSIVELSPKSKTFLPPPSFRRPSAPLLDRPSTATQLEIKKSGHPARHSSILRKKPAFLDTDPYSQSTSYSEPSPMDLSLESPLTPATPTGMMSRFQKGLSLVRKRSRANLTTSGDARDGSTFSYLRNGSTMTLAHLPSPQEESSTDSDSASMMLPKVSHTRSKTNTAPITHINPATPKRGLLQGFGKKRRQSLKI